MRVQYAFVVLAIATAVVRVDGYLDILSNLHDCGSTGLDTCLERRLARSIDEVLDKNETYRLNRYLTVTAVGNHRQHTEGDDLAARFLEFFNALQIQYQPEEDDGLTDDVSEVTGRKKKGYKKKNHKLGMMMGFTSMGMTIIGGLFNKMMMGGAISIAVKALIIAKIALLLAGTMAIKKLLSGSGVGVSVHPSWNGGGGGGGNEHHSGYRRSYPPPQSMTTADAMAYKDQIDSYSDAQYSG
ncbi:uncharacterized protein LOC103309212 [Acyrthosiphon pisum]|uniref:Uncharacterized protein n=1 Tax=Acyrthosiphon pisum TaxID=7029 RepID=A0A8R2D3J1_ACYPI|nr:uncharacterized protein LOC103309212 [Acyrthosiphon pisum]|eukprot:XP_016659262.1 PREDICTED: uncharacterized protein LOC103309212 [Acyrthosiphon pisum]